MARLHRGGITGLANTPASCSAFQKRKHFTWSPMSTGTTGVTDTPVSKPMARKPLCIFSAMSISRARRSGSAWMISSALRALATEAGVIDAEKMTERALWRM